MANILFAGCLGLLSCVFLAWGFSRLTHEHWQIALAAPAEKLTGGMWRGTNYTFYGFFQATAITIAAVILCLLIGSLDIRLYAPRLLVLAAALGMLVFPMSRLIARLVEKKRYTSTVGGAFFIGLLAAPWLVVLVNATIRDASLSQLPVMPFLAAGAASYVLGEGFGRLACISFGCCYGKPVASLPASLQKVFRPCAFVFRGATKKVAYEGHLEGQEVVPIQAITSIVLVATGVVSAYLTLAGRYASAFLLAVIVSQAWRCISETLRADFRGNARFSAYQIMALIGMAYAWSIYLLFPAGETVRADILSGLKHLWSPSVVLILQGLWLATFVFMGRSSVTESLLSFRVRENLT